VIVPPCPGAPPTYFVRALISQESLELNDLLLELDLAVLVEVELARVFP
jgi:hypothetical protein